MLHNRYDIRGGEDESTDCEYRMLRDHGHDIELLEANNSEIGRSISKVEAAVSAVWSRRWHGSISEKLRLGSFDVLHVQNFFPLISPAVHRAALTAKVPVVQAVRNYRLACPSANLFRDGHVCHECVGTITKFPGIRHACYRGSTLGSATVAAMSGVHRAIGTWSKVSAFVAISHYVREVLVEDGFSPDKIFVKPNFVEVEGVTRPAAHADRKHILYVGRLTREKGLDLLLEAYKASGLNIPLKLVGDGSVGAEGIAGVEVLGRRPLPDVYELMREAYCVVMPGRWAEPFGRVAIEAFAAGTPVIATNLGGVAEIIDHEETGLLLQLNDVASFAQGMKRLVDDAQASQRMSFAALQVFREKYSAESNHTMIMNIYKAVIEENLSENTA